MGSICEEPPERPKPLETKCLRDIYISFEDLFLHADGILLPPCGHTINVFDHHFFHMAKVGRNGHTRLEMRDEKETILNCREGFGDYEVDLSRAKYLSSAIETLQDPHEVWHKNPKANADWVYIREYDSKPYAFSIALVMLRIESELLVPVSSFPCKKSDLKKWRQGSKIYP
jgi:hypothetical protein